MNLFNGFGFGGFGKHGDGKGGCGCDNGCDIMSILMLVWVLSCCGIDCNFDICEILPLIILLSLLSNCCGGNQNPCKGPY